jgi:hypothetical protein
MNANVKVINMLLKAGLLNCCNPNGISIMLHKGERFGSAGLLIIFMSNEFKINAIKTPANQINPLIF